MTNEELWNYVQLLTEKIDTWNNNKSKLNKIVETLETEVETLKTDNKELKQKESRIERKIKDLESLIIRDNINVDLLANRDSLKTILLILSVNFEVSSNRKIKQISNNLTYKSKLTNLVLDVLQKLNDKLNQKTIWRKGFENDKTIKNEKKEEIKDKFNFVEYIHFIVCCIDNFIHPPQDKNNEDFEDLDIYSRLISVRTKGTLEKELAQFFFNQKNIDKLLDFINDKGGINGEEGHD